jgi:hypothetical protein
MNLKDLPTVETLRLRLAETKDNAIKCVENATRAAIEEVQTLHATLGGDLKLEGNALLNRATVALVENIDLGSRYTHDGQEVDLYRIELQTNIGQLSISSGGTVRAPRGRYRALLFLIRLPDGESES